MDMILKCFHELECPQLEEIQQQALAHLTKLYDFSDQESLNTDLWLKIDYKSLLKCCPALLEWTRSLNLHIKEVALTVVNNQSGVPLHIDELPVVAKINVPLLNYQHAINKWYEVPECIKSQYKPTVDQFNNGFCQFDDIDLSKCKLLGSVTMTKPIVFNSQIPHCVDLLPKCLAPRIIMPVMFINEPISYLYS